MNAYKPEGLVKNKTFRYRESELLQAMQEGSILEANVIKSDEELTLYIDLGKGVYGVIPYDECEMSVDGKATKSIAVISKVGKTVAFKVKSLQLDKEGKKYAILSRKSAQIECKKSFIDKLLPGQVIEAKVCHIESYGAFCDIGCGIIALLPIKNICVTRILDIKAELKNIKNLKVAIKSVDESGKITLTHKELIGTWEEEISKFKTGQTIIGTVKSVHDYGVFVELTPNLSGLAIADKNVKPGDKATVFIKSILPEQMKIKLLIISSEPSEINEARFEDFDYKITDGRIKHWKYSPDGIDKKIDTVFYEE